MAQRQRSLDSGASPLDEAKERLRIPDLARLRGWEWEPGKSCHVPYRPDKEASGSVFSHGKLFKDFATDEVLDGPALLAKMEDFEMAEACKVFIELAGIRSSLASSTTRRPRPSQHQQAAEPLPPLPKLPEFAPLTKNDMQKVAESRHVSQLAVTMAADDGLVRKCWYRGHLCWVVTDDARWVAQARRFDRGRFPCRNGEAEGPKAWTFKGGRAGWPIGIKRAMQDGIRKIALCEGGPDLLAAYHFISVQKSLGIVAPVAMLGASARIVPDALPLFNGMRVRIFAHADEPKPDTGKCAGMEAAYRWQEQLTAAGATVDTFDLSDLRMADGSPLNDLNDLTRCHPDDWQANAGDLDNLMHF